MILSNENINIWYKDYVKKYNNVKKFIKSRGGISLNIPILSRQAFEIDFRSITYDYPNINGKKLAEKLAQNQLYIRTLEQSKKAAEAEMRQVGTPVSLQIITEYMLGIRTVAWDNIKQTRKIMKAQGFTNEAAELFISQEFFDSQ